MSTNCTPNMSVKLTLMFELHTNHYFLNLLRNWRNPKGFRRSVYFIINFPERRSYRHISHQNSKLRLSLRNSSEILLSQPISYLDFEFERNRASLTAPKISIREFTKWSKMLLGTRICILPYWSRSYRNIDTVKLKSCSCKLKIYCR